ncbi:MAG: thioredoxin family protein [Candidatus Cloacimonetes bacterium]|nr:thioredoxin family protein [Candidatus Cloacimonadota bacterium]
MKLKALTLLLLIAFLVISGCERFTKPEPAEASVVEAEIIDFFDNSFLPAIESMTTTDVSSAMAFYSDNYLNNGITKSDIEQEYLTLMGNFTNPVFSYSVMCLNDETLKIQWNLIVEEANTKDLPVTDYLVRNGENFLFYGDQIEPPTEEKAIAFIEVLTATWCPNCPELEEKIDELKETYGNSLYFVEYHYQDGLSGDFSDIQGWYSIYSAPTGVIQGVNILVGSETNALSQYDGLVQTIVNQDAEITLKNFTYSVDGSVYTLNVDFQNPGNISSEDLYLRYMMVEDTSSTMNYAGHPCRNVMLQQNRIALNDEDLNGTYTFTHTCSLTLPDDAKIIVLVQKMDETYSDTTCKVYYALEANLNQ